MVSAVIKSRRGCGEIHDPTFLRKTTSPVYIDFSSDIIIKIIYFDKSSYTLNNKRLCSITTKQVEPSNTYDIDMLIDDIRTVLLGSVDDKIKELLRQIKAEFISKT